MHWAPVCPLVLLKSCYHLSVLYVSVHFTFSAHPLFIFKAFGMGPSSAVVYRLETRRVVFELQHIGMPNGSRVTEKEEGGGDW